MKRRYRQVLGFLERRIAKDVPFKKNKNLLSRCWCFCIEKKESTEVFFTVLVRFLLWDYFKNYLLFAMNRWFFQQIFNSQLNAAINDLQSELNCYEYLVQILTLESLRPPKAENFIVAKSTLIKVCLSLWV